jgi:hypothetical protein
MGPGLIIFKNKKAESYENSDVPDKYQLNAKKMS